MNFNELKQKQQAFDDFVIRLHSLNLTENELFIKKAHSLSCEVWEVANELAYFKYWKVNHRVDSGKLLEEIADCLFFQLSMANDLGTNLTHQQYEPLSMEERFHYLHKYAFKLTDEKYDTVMRCRYLDFFHNHYVGLIHDLGLDEPLIRQAYSLKYKKNINRQCEGY